MGLPSPACLMSTAASQAFAQEVSQLLQTAFCQRPLCTTQKMENNKWVRTLFNQVVACHTLMSKLPPIVAVVVLKVKVTQQCLTLCDPMNYIVHGILQARILKWVALPLLQGIFPNQGSNPGLLHCRWFLYQLSHQGSLRILELVAYPFSRGSSQSRN